MKEDVKNASREELLELCEKQSKRISTLETVYAFSLKENEKLNKKIELIQNLLSL